MATCVVLFDVMSVLRGHQPVGEEAKWQKVLEGGTAQAELHQGYSHVVLLECDKVLTAHML